MKELKNKTREAQVIHHQFARPGRLVAIPDERDYDESIWEEVGKDSPKRIRRVSTINKDSKEDE